MSPFSIDLEPIEVGPFIEVEGWPDEVLSRATVRWKRPGTNLVATFSPLPNRSVAVHSVMVEGSPERPVTSADLRSFQFRQLTNALVTFLVTWEPGSLWATVSISQITREDIEQARTRQRERPPMLMRLNLSDELLDMLEDPEQLAEFRAKGPRTWAAVSTVNYLLDYAAEHGLSPHTLVREVLGLPKATASRWIAVARELRAGTSEGKN